MANNVSGPLPTADLTELRAKLSDCRNPWDPPNASGYVWNDIELESVGFVKFGGEPWRNALFPEQYSSHLAATTQFLLGGLAMNSTDAGLCPCSNMTFANALAGGPLVVVIVAVLFSLGVGLIYCAYTFYCEGSCQNETMEGLDASDSVSPEGGEDGVKQASDSVPSSGREVGVKQSRSLD